MRHLSRVTLVPALAASSSAICHWASRSIIPKITKALTASTPTPCLPALTIPAGDHNQGVVVRDAGAAGPQPEAPRALPGGRDHHLGRGDDLPPGTVVLADPGLVVAESVEPLDQLEVTLQCEGRVLAHAVEGGH